MNKNFFLLLTFAILLSGTACSPQGWTARWHIVQAENARGKANKMKEHKAGFDQRLPWYAKACHSYLKAYETDSAVFTLTRIEEAADCCWKANLREEEAVFHAFETEYNAAHPQEVEYGDAGVGMIDAG
jgi:hypothetical protein